MTIKEIAEVAGVSYQTVHRTIAGIYPGKMKDGKKTELSHEESIKVMGALRKKNFVTPSQNEHVSSQNGNLELSDDELNRAFKVAILSLEGMVKDLARKDQEKEIRLSNIEKKIEKRQALLPPPQIKPRDHINMIVRDYAYKTGRLHSDVWSELYRQFSYRTNTDPRKCAKNRNMGILEYIELEGFIETLEAIAIDVFKED